jgi:hypothetical protein
MMYCRYGRGRPFDGSLALAWIWWSEGPARAEVNSGRDAAGATRATAICASTGGLTREHIANEKAYSSD